ncbi:unnamed protein product, partial [Rotaria socialis]
MRQLKDNNFQGKDKMDFSDGNNYTADWADGIRADQAFLDKANKQLSEQLEDDKFQGKGKMDFSDGNNYTDDLADNTSTGESTLVVTN